MVFQTINRTFQFRLITRFYLFFIIVCIFFCGEKDSKKNLLAPVKTFNFVCAVSNETYKT